MATNLPELLAGMEPVLHPGSYVFCTVTEGGLIYSQRPPRTQPNAINPTNPLRVAEGRV